ncbi:GATA-binding factor 2-like protein [Dinothrombium tinctorium]|uniref:GATA-binding factor 2-like protein n=1 Tax=Dinothrombium tinctorium TaxID=1965070 RepID=A0A3S3Q6G9_9ACAR|nr:GATA-binding factor 2-like protein [Dinothrombium tinctorium]
MKKEGIQTRNRKLSSKGKKKKGVLAYPDVIKALDNKPFASFAPTPGQLSSAMSSMSAMSAVNHYMHGTQMPISMGGSPFMTGPTSMHMNMSGGPHHHLSLPTSGPISLGTGSLGLGSTNSMVGAMA